MSGSREVLVRKESAAKNLEIAYVGHDQVSIDYIDSKGNVQHMLLSISEDRGSIKFRSTYK